MSCPRPISPNMQNYRPQLTSVMSFGHRLSGAALALAAFGLAGWLVTAALWPGTFEVVQAALETIPAQVLLFLITFALFYHLCNGIRHLIWDSVHAFELRSIYTGGWTVMAASLVLTIAIWIWGMT